MRDYRVQKFYVGGGLFLPYVGYAVQMKILWFWVTIKTFVCDDPDDAKLQAVELLDKLQEEE